MAMERSTTKREAALIGLAAIGGGLGIAGIIELIKKRPAATAPETEKLDHLIELLESIGANGVVMESDLKTIIDILNSLPIPPGGGPSGGNLWIAKEPLLIFNAAIRNAGTFPTDLLVDCRNVKRMFFKVDNTLNQPVSIQLIGNHVESFLQTVNIGPPVPCVAAGQTSIGLAWDDWVPWIGATITTALAPTAGDLQMWGVVQE